MMKMKKIIIVGVVLLLVIGGVIVAAVIQSRTNITNTPNTLVGNNSQVVKPEPREKEAEVNLYYSNNKFIESGDEKLEKVLPIKKKISYGTFSLAEAAVRELFKDPGIEGFSTGIPKDIQLIGVKVVEHMAYVDFSSQNLSGSTLQERMTVDQIVETLTNLEGIESVQFKVDGKQVDSFLEQLAREPFYKKKDLKIEELQLGEIKLKMKKDEFILKFGQPSSKQVDQSGNVEYLEYPNLKVSIRAGQIVEVSTTSEAYPTLGGLKIGDSFKKVMSIYGEPSSSYRKVLTYKVDQESNSLQIKVEDGKVVEIRIN